MALTILILVLMAVALSAIVVSGRLASSVGDAIGLGKQVVTLYEIVKWPVLSAAVVIVSGLYASPSGRRPATTRRLLTPGGAFAIVAWTLVSAGFGIYTNLFASRPTAPAGALGTASPRWSGCGSPTSCS